MASTDAVKKVQQDRLELLARVGLEMAGFKPAHLRKAHRRDVEALDAETVKRYHNREGVVTSEVRDTDHYARMAAARAIKQMVPGMFPSQGAGMERSESATINVQIILLDATGGQRTIDVTSPQVSDAS